MRDSAPTPPPSILVLADLSAAAEKAAQYAAAAAVSLTARLTLLHLQQSPVMVAPELVAMSSAQATEEEAELATGLDELARRLPGQTEVVMTTGPMFEAVADAVRRYCPLLLAVGLSADDNLLDNLLNNHVLPVLRATRQPLLLVPAGASSPPGLPHRIVLALDAEPFAFSAASQRLTQFFAACPAAYTVVHINANDEQTGSPGQLAVADVRACALLPPAAPIDLYEEDHRHPATGILQAVADTEADLLVLIARPRSFLNRLFHESVTAQILRRSPVPVLLLPAEGPEGADWMPTMS